MVKLDDTRRGKQSNLAWCVEYQQPSIVHEFYRVLSATGWNGVTILRHELSRDWPMSLLLIILFAAGIKPPPPVPQVILTPPSVDVILEWDNHPTNWLALGISNRLYSWTAWKTVEIVYPSGVTNQIVVPDNVTSTNIFGTNRAKVTQLRDVRTYYHVTSVLNESESEPSNVVGNPPKTVDTIWSERSTNGVDWANLSTNPIAFWTNQPVVPQMIYRLRAEREQTYEP